MKSKTKKERLSQLSAVRKKTPGSNRINIKCRNVKVSRDAELPDYSNWYYLQSPQIPRTTISACMGLKPFGSFTCGTVTSSRQIVLLHVSHIKCT